jgi:hypothetical protein
MITPSYRTAITYLNEFEKEYENIDITQILSLEFPSYYMDNTVKEYSSNIFSVTLERQGDIVKEIKLLGSQIEKCDLYIGGILSGEYINNNVCKKMWNIKLNFISIRTQYNNIELKIYASKIINIYSKYSILPTVLRNKIVTIDCIIQLPTTYDIPISNLVYKDGFCATNKLINCDNIGEYLILQ